jgi:hypothetical protein
MKSVDDWKKKRREKQKVTSRPSQSGDDEIESSKANKNERKRINKFENSQYYLKPLDGDELNAGVDDQLTTTTTTETTTQLNEQPKRSDVLIIQTQKW